MKHVEPAVFLSEGTCASSRRGPSNIPPSLTVVRALTRGLEEEPLVQEILLRGCIVGQSVRLVVLIDQVADDRTRLPEENSGAGVLDRCGWVESQSCHRSLEAVCSFGLTLGWRDCFLPGARPLGLMSVNGAFLSSAASQMTTVSNGRESSVRTMATCTVYELRLRTHVYPQAEGEETPCMD